jgi:hypothetical protein
LPKEDFVRVHVRSITGAASTRPVLADEPVTAITLVSAGVLA